MVDGVDGSPGIRVARIVDKAYNTGGGLVTTQHPRQVVDIASGAARSIRHARTYSAMVKLIFLYWHLLWFQPDLLLREIQRSIYTPTEYKILGGVYLNILPLILLFYF